MGGHGFIILNILRLANIIALFLGALTSWIILIMSFKNGTFFFFTGVSHIILSAIFVFLIISEFAIFDRYFAKHWPVFGPESGLVFLGVSMLCLGSSLLGNLNLEVIEDHDELDYGIHLWRLVLGSGILIMLLGLINIIATYLFSNPSQGITGRQMRLFDLSNRHKGLDSHRAFNSSTDSKYASFSLSAHRQSSMSERKKSRFRFPLAIDKSSNSSTQYDSHQKWPHNISSPIPQKDDANSEIYTDVDVNFDLEKSEKDFDGGSSIFPDLQRPPTALHPAFNQNELQYSTPYPASSRYSVVSNITRF